TPAGTAVGASNCTVTGPSDLGVSLTTSSVLMPRGQALTYTIHALNSGGATVSSVVLTDFLPADADVVSVTSTDTTCAITDNTVVCAVPVFPPQMQLAVVIVVLPRVEGVFVDSVTLTAAESEIRPADNTASVATTVVSDAS